MTPSHPSAAPDRAAALVRPGIAALAGYVPGEQPQGGEWIKLNTNENPYAPSPEVAGAVTALLAGRTLAKYPDPVATRFREKAAEILGVDPDWILCGNGSDDLLTILVRTFVGTGEALRVPTPSYILYRTLAGIQGVACEEIPYERDWSLGAAFCSPATAAGEPVRLAIIANPNSPSGTLIPPDAVAALAARLSCALVVDEAYGDLTKTSIEGPTGVLASRIKTIAAHLKKLRSDTVSPLLQVYDDFGYETATALYLLKTIHEALERLLIEEKLVAASEDEKKPLKALKGKDNVYDLLETVTTHIGFVIKDAKQCINFAQLIR